MTAAIYCRLSREDEEKQSESESIQNQKSMLIKYALDKGWDIYNIYCDEDYSGIDRERPAFRQLIADAEARQFDIVLVKTQSRFTRDMELVEKYIHGLFAEWGIQFCRYGRQRGHGHQGQQKSAADQRPCQRVVSGRLIGKYPYCVRLQAPGGTIHRRVPALRLPERPGG